jgi:hypothetical protein
MSSLFPAWSHKQAIERRPVQTDGMLQHRLDRRMQANDLFLAQCVGGALWM